MSLERIKIISSKIDSEAGREYALLGIPWLAKSKGLNPLPVNYYIDERDEFLFFVHYLSQVQDKSSTLFIPPYGDQDTYTPSISPLLDKASAHYRSHYYSRFSHGNLESLGYQHAWAPATTLFLPEETITEHIARMRFVFGKGFKVVSPKEVVRALGKEPQEWGDKLFILGAPIIFKKVYSNGISARRFLELIEEVSPENFETYDDYFVELSRQGKYFPRRYG